MRQKKQIKVTNYQTLMYPDLGYPYELRKSRGKSISLTIYPNNFIILRIPNRMPKNQVIEFLQERKSWVQAKFQDNKKHNPKRAEFKDGDLIPIFGKLRQVIHTKNQETKLSNTILYLNIKGIKSESGFRTRALSFLKNELLQIASPILTDALKQIGTKNYDLKIRKMRTLWGSCSSNHQISLNLGLIFCPMEVIKYVIVHEATHTKVFNHSTEFWNLLSALDKNFMKSEKWLKADRSKTLCYLL